jgi:predicted CoA-substrate-specific enzyme activase
MEERMITVGIDVGSITTEALVYDPQRGILGYSIILTGGSSYEAASVALEKALIFSGVKRDGVKRIVATGAGRGIVDFAHKKVTEITCLARGVHYLFPEARTVIDIGGQDTKVIRINEKGQVVEFDMNDKCAAGTGRFLEVMARALGVELDKMGEISLRAKKDLSISSICTVFAESEVVSLVSQGEQVEEILRAVHKAIAKRTVGLLERIGGPKPQVVMTGGVAKNVGVVRALEEEIKMPLTVYFEPQIVCALGAALLAQEV